MGKYPTLTQTLFAQADANGDGSSTPANSRSLQGLTAGLGEAAGVTNSDNSSSNDNSANDSSSSQESHAKLSRQLIGFDRLLKEPPRTGVAFCYAAAVGATYSGSAGRPFCSRT